MPDLQLILTFLSDLKDNNRKEWMDENRQRYENARDEFRNLVSTILEEMKGFDNSLALLSAKDCIFRINRDIRFSADKTPYKTWMSAVLAEGGKKSENAIYYLHLQPGNESMAAGGLYQPAGANLKKIRQEVDYNAAELKEIVSNPDFVEIFGSLQGEKLSRAPKGYPADHPNIEFLKLKSFLALRNFSDEEVVKADFPDKVIRSFKAARPLNDYLNVAVS